VEDKPMALLDTGVKAVTDRLPKVISPKTHAIIDYGVVGSFALMGALFWRSSKRAAIASWACAAGEATVAMLTDYPGGVAKVISFETHGKIDAGMSGAVATLPSLLGFGNQKKAIFFRAQGVGMAATTGMTDFESYSRSYRRRAA
jgi:hypothetical protein